MFLWFLKISHWIALLSKMLCNWLSAVMLFCVQDDTVWWRSSHWLHLLTYEHGQECKLLWIENIICYWPVLMQPTFVICGKHIGFVAFAGDKHTTYNIKVSQL